MSLSKVTLACIELVEMLRAGLPVRHSLGGEDETFILHEGVLEFYEDDRTFTGRPGDVIFLVRGKRHYFKVISGNPARYTVVCVPGGFDRFFREAAVEFKKLQPDRSFREEAQADGEGWRLPARESLLDAWGLQPGAAREYVRRRLCDFTLHCFEQKVRLPSNAAGVIHKAFIAAVSEKYPARFVFERFGARAYRERWDYHELATGHDCHVEAPDRFVSLLLARDARSVTER